MKVLIYTASAGGYDHPVPPVEQKAPGHEVAYHCIPDADLPPVGNPRLRARHPKCLPPTGYDVTIWLDGNIVVDSPDMVADLLGHLGDAELALWRHCARTDIVAEAEATIGMAKYAEVCRHQIEWARGITPRPRELWELHAMVRRDTWATRTMGQVWWSHTLAHSRPGPGGVFLDQVSLPVMLGLCGLEPAVVPGNVWETDWWPADGSHVGSHPGMP